MSEMEIKFVGLRYLYIILGYKTKNPIYDPKHRRSHFEQN
jgi:hypothetical protein